MVISIAVVCSDPPLSFVLSFCLPHTPHTQFQFASKHYFLACHPPWFASTQMFALSPFTHLIGLFKTEIWMGNSAVPSNPFPPNWNGWYWFNLGLLVYVNV